MKVKLYGIPLLLVLTVSLAAAGISQNPQGRAEEKEAPGFSSLTLHLATTKHRYIRLEPVPVVLRLSNPTRRKVEATTTLNIEANEVELIITDPAGQEKRIRGLSSQSSFYSPGVLTIKPGESYSEKQVLALALNDIFRESGKYHLQVGLYDRASREQILSNTVSVSIVEPEGLDGSAFNYLTNNVDPSTFFESVSRSSPAKAEEFVELYGESVYADYVTYLLGRYYWNHEKYDKAEKHFEKLSKKPDFVFAERVKGYMEKLKANTPQQ